MKTLSDMHWGAPIEFHGGTMRRADRRVKGGHLCAIWWVRKGIYFIYRQRHRKPLDCWEHLDPLTAEAIYQHCVAGLDTITP